MPVRLRFRTDSAFKADDTAARARGEKLQWHHGPELDEDPVPPAEPGDVWRVRWGGTLDQQQRGEQGPIAGYEICCIKCKHIHAWCTSTNCQPRVPWSVSWIDENGATQTSSGMKCLHEGVGSCWTWTGSPEQGNLSAQPSLWSVVEKGGCGYHGFLTNGILSDG